MAQRDIQFIIRAKDEASRAFQKLSDSLADIAKEQLAVQESAAGLSKNLDTASVEAAQAASTGSLERMRESANGVQQAYDAIARAAERAAAKLTEQRAKTDETAKSLSALKTQASAAAGVLERLKKANEATSAKDAAEVKRLSDSYKALTARAEQARVELDSIKSADSLTAEQVNDVRRLEKAYEGLVAEVDRAKAAYEESEKSASGSEKARVEKIALVEKAYKDLSREVARAEKTLAQQQGAVQQAERGLKELEGKAATARIGIRAMWAEFAKARVGTGAIEQQKIKLNELAGSNARAKRTVFDLVRELFKIPPAATAAGSSLGKAAKGANGMRTAMASFYGDSRRALSLMQRIRGEFLSLTASAVGFYAVFRQGQGIYTAFSDLQAAQNRLGAAFEGDTAAVSREIGYLQNQARRLGFSFNVLSAEYSKFLISAKAANFTTEETRQVFQRVIETSRVMKLSTEQIKGVLTALTQIAGKGTLQMEELRQQLGDRFPGAVSIMASALGYGSDELGQFYKDVENGLVDAKTALTAFAGELEDRFGGQLAESLKQVSVQVGRLQNNIFNRQITAGNAGFMDGLEAALERINGFLESDKGVEFFEKMGAAAGRAVEFLSRVVDHIDLIVAAIKVLVSIKISQTIFSALAAFNTGGGGFAAASRDLGKMSALAATFGVNIGAAAKRTSLVGVALRGLRPILIGVTALARGLWAALGGPIGILTAAISYFAVNALGSMATEVDKVNSALERHRKIVETIRGAWAEAKSGGREFTESLKDLSAAELQKNLEDLRDAAAETRESVLASLPSESIATRQQLVANGFDDLADSFVRTTRAFVEGEATTEEYRAVLDQVREALVRSEEELQATGEALTDAERETLDFVVTAGKLVDKVDEIESSMAEAEASIRVVGGTASETDQALLDLGDAAEQAGDSFAEQVSKVQEFDAAIQTLAKNIPGVAEQLRRMQGLARVEAEFQAAIRAANALPEQFMRDAAVQQAIQVYRDARKAFEVANTDYTRVVTASASSDLGQRQRAAVEALTAVAERLGVATEDLVAVVGYESGGTFDPGKYGGAGGEYLGLIQFSPDNQARYGVTPGQTVAEQAAAIEAYLRDTGIGPGDTLLNIYAAINAGNKYAFNASDAANGGRPGSVADKVQSDPVFLEHQRIAEALVETYGGIVEAATEEEQVRQRTAQAAQDFREGLNRQLEQEEFLLSIQEQNLLDREVAKALREAELEAADAGVRLSEEERTRIEEITRAKFMQQYLDEQRQAADEAHNTKLEEARQIEAEVTRLKERRQFLEEQKQYLLDSGDGQGAAQVDEELTVVNQKLDEAIQKAIAFWQALGGPQADAAIQKLQQTQAELARTATTSVTSGQQIAQMFAGIVTSAIDRFVKRVAAGEDAVTAFKEEFLRMAAEFLIKIGQMIIQQAILNALQAGQGGGVAGGIAGLINGLFHGGGVAGHRTPSTRSIHPGVMAAAIRYHTGGIAGLQPNEVPAILKVGEEVLTETDPRHRRNGGLGGQVQDMAQPTIINTVDAESFVDAALSTPQGEQMVLNVIRAQRDEVKAALAG